VTEPPPRGNGARRVEKSPGENDKSALWYQDATGQDVVRAMTGQYRLIAESHAFQIWFDPEDIKPFLLAYFDITKSRRRGHVRARPKHPDARAA
jgi:hypothetical protein